MDVVIEILDEMELTHRNYEEPKKSNESFIDWSERCSKIRCEGFDDSYLCSQRLTTIGC
jgi:hypothetical protein